MGIFKDVKIKKVIEEITGEIEMNPYYKRIDMPKPVFIRVDSIDRENKKVTWTNQYTSSSLDIMKFREVHEHLENEDDILEAMELLEGK